MDLGISGKLAMVAAGSKGIGYAAAAALIKEGCEVSMCARSQDSVSNAVHSLGSGCRGFVADVSKLEDLVSWHDQTVALCGTPDILVTNTGGPPAGNVIEITDAQWEEGVQSTLLNIIRMVRLVVPGMREKKWGRIVHVSSLVAKEPSRLLPISSTLRTGIMALTKLQAYELAEDQITVNGILPGHTRTARQEHLIDIRSQKEGISKEEAAEKQAASTAMKRFAEPHEVGDAICFLSSQAASYISGVSLLVDGATTCAFG
jgi:3-oxoacyl-[acyl-carrier protein] reductase